jgi:outer membrane protein assembly factor BamA
MARINLLELPAARGKRRLELLAGAAGGYNWMTIYPGSKLEQDVASRSGTNADAATLRRLLVGTDNHGSLVLSTGLLWDSRDHEFAPTRGMLTELSLQLAPGVDDKLSYARFHFSNSSFAPLYEDHLVVAGRGLVDWLEGRPPLYELTQFGVVTTGDGPGGSQSVRGVLRHRYHGKIKVIGNLELRGQFPWFRVLGERFRIGVVGFVDAGRAWADVEPQYLAGRDLDGPQQPFDVGTGGGLRIQWGEAFVLRADGAYSPTDRTPGFYVDLGHVF